MPLTPHPRNEHQTEYLEQRANRQRDRHRRSTAVRTVAVPSLQRVTAAIQLLPSRFIFHVLTALLVPLAVVVSQFPLTVEEANRRTISQLRTDTDGIVTSLVPLRLDEATADQAIPDSAFADIDALAVRPFDRSLLENRPVPALIINERANVRGGPGTIYDRLDTVPADTLIHILARWEDWYKAQLPDGRIVWVLSELISADPDALDLLPAAIGIPVPPPPKVGVVAETGLNLRDGPGKHYVGMQALSAGVSLDLLARYQDWLQVQAPDGRIGWVTQAYLTIEPNILDRVEVVTSIPDPNPELVAAIEEQGVNLRNGPGTVYNKLAVLEQGIHIELVARYQDWFKIRTPRGTEGWVSNELIAVSSFVTRRVPVTSRIPVAPTQRQSPAAGIRKPIQFAPASATSGPVQFARQFIGSPYVWGAASPDRGFDCSGFTKYVFAQYGLNLPHSSGAQYSTSYGAAVTDPTMLQPGDIVFFVNTYKPGISHVGIYVGGGDVVQALTPGRGVGIANLNERYWASRYYGAIRPRI